MCNTAAGSVDLFNLLGNSPTFGQSIPVGSDPVSVCFRDARELWVVNQISDTVSVVDLDRNTVVRTLKTLDEPADVVFAGQPRRAYVSCSQANAVLVFQLDHLDAAPEKIEILGEDPRALAVSPDGKTVYAAVFESGNGTTILGGGGDGVVAFPPNVVNDPGGPYGGTNPPPNDGNKFNPLRNPEAGTPPPVGLIVRKDAAGKWRDDNGKDWTRFVSGSLAKASGRPTGWDLIDNDVAIIDTSTNNVSYATGLMHLCMAVSVNPMTGAVSVVGTDATNEVRFEPNLNGRFLRVNFATVSANGATENRTDLNPHLDYSTPRVHAAVRKEAIGELRGIVWRANGNIAYVSGRGSNNVVAIDRSGNRLVNIAPIPVGEGPTGLAIHEERDRLYVLNQFDGSLSTIDLTSHSEIARTPFFDPTPVAIKTGRKHLYDTHRTSGLGHVSCASCHADARMDRLAWDLGDPAGEVKEVSSPRHNLGANVPALNTGFTDFHPMKGPMTTQTLQDIIGKEPHHWRGDKDGIEEFNGAYVALMGDDEMLTDAEMQELEDYLATIYFPPNPYRNLDNSLPTNLPLPGQFTSGRAL